MNAYETTALLDIAERVVDVEVLEAQLQILTGIMFDSLNGPVLSDVNRGGMTAASLCIAATLLDQANYDSDVDFTAALDRVQEVLGEIVKFRILHAFGAPLVVEWEDGDPDMN